jgi:predicted component of type VI protein secretion system
MGFSFCYFFLMHGKARISSLLVQTGDQNPASKMPTSIAASSSPAVEPSKTVQLVTEMSRPWQQPTAEPDKTKAELGRSQEVVVVQSVGGDMVLTQQSLLAAAGQTKPSVSVTEMQKFNVM